MRPECAPRVPLTLSVAVCLPKPSLHFAAPHHAPAPRLMLRNKSLSLDSDPDSLLPACRESSQPGRGRESYSRSTHSLYQCPARGPTVRVCSSQSASAPLLYNALTPSSPAPSSPNFSRPNYCASPPRPHLSHTRYGAHCTIQPQLSSRAGSRQDLWDSQILLGKT